MAGSGTPGSRGMPTWCTFHDVPREIELPFDGRTVSAYRMPVDPRVELLWFSDCPNHAAARRMVLDSMARHGISGQLIDIDATDPAVAAAARFPGSPTIRVDGVDIDPSYVDPGDYTPRCRLYRTGTGLRGVPDTAWIESAMAAASRHERD